jgi:hypothetical protein
LCRVSFLLRKRVDEGLRNGCEGFVIRCIFMNALRVYETVNFFSVYPMHGTVYWWGLSSCTKSVTVLQSDDFLGCSGPRTLFAIETSSAVDISEYSYVTTNGVAFVSAIRHDVYSTTHFSKCISCLLHTMLYTRADQAYKGDTRECSTHNEQR